MEGRHEHDIVCASRVHTVANNDVIVIPSDASLRAPTTPIQPAFDTEHMTMNPIVFLGRYPAHLIQKEGDHTRQVLW